MPSRNLAVRMTALSHLQFSMRMEGCGDDTLCTITGTNQCKHEKVSVTITSAD